MKKQIIIEVNPEGEVKIDALGFKGSACELATKDFERALGVTGKRTKKPEYAISQGNQTKAVQ